MQINSMSIAKKTLKDKSVTVKRLENNLIRVSYEGASPRNTPKPMILPRIIEVDKEVAENIGMYIGDGTLNSKKRRQLEFTTIDIGMAKNYLKFLKNRFFIKTKDKQLLMIEQFNALVQINGKNLNDFYDQINKVRIGKLTYLPFSREFVDFIVK